MSKRGNILDRSDIGKQKKSAHRIQLTGVYIRIRNFAVLRLQLALYSRQILFTDHKTDYQNGAAGIFRQPHLIIVKNKES